MTQKGGSPDQLAVIAGAAGKNNAGTYPSLNGHGEKRRGDLATRNHSTAALRTWLTLAGLEFNPFNEMVAEKDPDLNDYFFDRQRLDPRIAAPDSALIFAGPGCGKTALGLYLNYLHRNQRAGVLSLIYQASELLAPSGGLRVLTPSAARDLLLQICEGWPSFEAQFKDPDLIGRLQAFLRPLDDDDEHLEHLVQKILEDDSLISLVRGRHRLLTSWDGSLWDGLPAFLRSLLQTDPAGLPDDEERQLDSLIEFAAEIGFKHIVFVVDGFESLQKDASPLRQMSPILDQMVRLEKHQANVSWKLILPDEYRSALEKAKDINFRKLTIAPVWLTITWREPELTDFIRLRLEAATRRQISSIESLAEPRLRGRLEKEILALAEYSPRRCQEIINALITTHVEKRPERLLFSSGDWQDARERLEKSRH